VYEIIENEVIIYIIAIGKRDKIEVYEKAGERREL
jgi:mRNA-degrading endonuclease RelE of RelBE toxin-antitoxin system